jgi:hypothetical protein
MPIHDVQYTHELSINERKRNPPLPRIQPPTTHDTRQRAPHCRALGMGTWHVATAYTQTPSP